MDGYSLKSRAIAFALSIGAVAFILAILAATDAQFDARTIGRALTAAVICGVMAWATAENALAGLAVSIDAATARIVAASHGDLTEPTPAAVGETLPELAGALDGLFRQVRANLDTVHALAMFDPVTSLSNRVNFRREAERLLRGVGEDELSALFFVDLDNFKAVNDSFGHAQGDQVLSMVANRLRAVVAAEAVRLGVGGVDPLVGRLAGDEFTVLFPRVGNIAAATRIARAMLGALNEPFDLGGHEFAVGASIGVALRPDHGHTLTLLMRAADVAMYHAKACGRAQYQFFSEALAGRLADRSRTEADLRAALQRDEFSLSFQPQISLSDGTVIAAEALVRWEHPREGEKLPASFINIAEESGLIVELGNWAIDAVADALAMWPRATPAQRLAVNLSPRQLIRHDFFPRLRAALAERDAPLHLLEFELSETTAMEAGDAAIAEIAALRAQGVTIALDNFGSGYSNLARLRQLPLDRIKLDRGLVADIVGSAEARAIVQAVVALIHGLGCKAVAEGVESAEQLDVLRVIGCDAAQGFAVAAPMPIEAYAAWSPKTRKSKRA